MKNSQAVGAESPASLGFTMPAEWEKHEATWLGWPHNPTDWPDKLDTIRWVYGEMVRRIGAGRNCTDAGQLGQRRETGAKLPGARRGSVDRVEFIAHPTNRGWMRDSGPIFVRRRAGGKRETAIVHFHFNAWAKYDDWQKDRKAPETAAKLLGKRLFDATVDGREFVIEGGGIDVNGRGTLLTTEECYLDPTTRCATPGLRGKDSRGRCGNISG